MAKDIHPQGDEAMAEMEREQEASRARNRQAEADANAARIAAVQEANAPADDEPKKGKK